MVVCVNQFRQNFCKVFWASLQGPAGPATTCQHEIRSFQGGGKAQTMEQKLLHGLQAVIRDVVSNPTPVTKGGGKGGKTKNKSNKQDTDSLNKKGDEYGLVQALQQLTARAAAQPQGLLDRLKTLIDVTEKGKLKPGKRWRKRQATAPATVADGASRTVAVPKNAENIGAKPRTRWSQSRAWKARAQDWGVKQVLRGSGALCHALDENEAGNLLCQATDLQDWSEALLISQAAGRKDITVVYGCGLRQHA